MEHLWIIDLILLYVLSIELLLPHHVQSPLFSTPVHPLFSITYSFLIPPFYHSLFSSSILQLLGGGFFFWCNDSLLCGLTALGY